MRVKLTEQEKTLALHAASAADKLIHIWNFLNQDRGNEDDLESARKYTETLVTFGRMIEAKLRPEFEPQPEPEPQTEPRQEEVSPKPVEAPDPSPEPANSACAASDGGTKTGDDQTEGVLRDETVLGRIKRLFR